MTDIFSADWHKRATYSDAHASIASAKPGQYSNWSKLGRMYSVTDEPCPGAAVSYLVPPYATQLARFALGLSAWNMPDRLRAQLKRRTRNQHGTRYTFTDGSAAFVPAGSASVEVRA